MTPTNQPITIHDQPWPRDPLPETASGDAGPSVALTAIEQYYAVEYRDDLGKLYHRYDLPSTDEYFYQFRHYFRYFGTNFHHMEVSQLKYRFIFYLLMIVKKIATVRGRISILEIGVTVGENYTLLKDAIQSEGLDVEVEYVGIDHDRRVVNLSRELHAGDPNFISIHGEGSDLRRFPDQSFDIVASNSVHNYLNDTPLSYTESFRVSRVAVVLHLLATRSPTSLRVTSSQTGQINHIPSLADVIGMLRSMEPYVLYRLSKFWSTGLVKHPHGPSDGIYLEDVDDTMVRWNAWVFSRYDFMPELDLVKHRIGSGPKS